MNLPSEKLNPPEKINKTLIVSIFILILLTFVWMPVSMANFKYSMEFSCWGSLVLCLAVFLLSFNYPKYFWIWPISVFSGSLLSGVVFSFFVLKPTGDNPGDAVFILISFMMGIFTFGTAVFGCVTRLGASKASNFFYQKKRNN
jgi:hypothetical protein